MHRGTITNCSFDSGIVVYNAATPNALRLTAEARRTSVTPFARALLKSPAKHVAFAIGAGIIVIGIIVWAFLVNGSEARQAILLNQLSFMLYIIFLTEVWNAAKIIRANHTALERYRVLYQTNRGKPV